MKVESPFSYVEMLVVVTILALAASVVVPRLSDAGAKTGVCELLDVLQQMRAYLDLYRVQHGDCLPPTDSLAAFELAMTRQAAALGLYIEKIPINPFNNLSTVRFDGEPAGAGKAGWRFDTNTGVFQADNHAVHAAL